MEFCYDLHTHSTASDGTCDPTTLVTRAKHKGVDVLALTDHDSVAGLREAAEACRDLGIHFIPGVEISVTWAQQTIHVLGLGVDAQHNELLQGLRRLGDYRLQRAERIHQSFAKAGIPDALPSAQRLAGSLNISRTHFARFLVEAGYVPNLQKAFKKYLTKGRPGYVSSQWAPLHDAVGWIRAAGGQAVIAHPMRYRLTRTKLLRLIEDFKSCGGVGLEVAYARSSKDEIMLMANHAAQHRLYASRGSDFHSPDLAYTELGQAPQMPTGCTPIWQHWVLPDLAASRP